MYLSIAVFLLKLLIGHLNEHIVIDLVRSAARIPVDSAVLFGHFVLRFNLNFCNRRNFYW